jgi:hypothetical protein
VIQGLRSLLPVWAPFSLLLDQQETAADRPPMIQTGSSFQYPCSIQDQTYPYSQTFDTPDPQESYLALPVQELPLKTEEIQGMQQIHSSLRMLSPEEEARMHWDFGHN